MYILSCIFHILTCVSSVRSL